ncbi:uncharacterized protein LAJ45_04632 [Morchella importuna]|uniref:uncharacterized protein n=1 Tax=Morchella importuna TaxID=1174673 RepID=UPI001E8E5DAC|nr:uncharacterized protein LAJ45_04632 [Morchella importuna]KAH8151427.1 hypothetical protein LAJ45_04632 [Morchella importuna]
MTEQTEKARFLIVRGGAVFRSGPVVYGGDPSWALCHRVLCTYMMKGMEYFLYNKLPRSINAATAAVASSSITADRSPTF